MKKRVFFVGCLAWLAMLSSSATTAGESGRPAGKAICPVDANGRHEQAIKAICRKALAGDREAQYETGLIALRGAPPMRSQPEKAAAWFEKAARQGSTDAMYLLGTQYASGTGLYLDEARARQWFIQAAEKGHPLAQMRLSECYALGIGGETDRAAAGKWYAKAQASGNYYAKRGLSPDDLILLADPMTRAKAGDPVAQYFAARYNHAIRYRIDYDRMEKWYQKSADQGYAPAQVKLGILYTQDAPGKKDLAKAAALFRAAAAQGDAEGQFELALLYLDGRDKGGDTADAIALLRQSVAQGNADACRLMGTLYRRGIGVAKNPEVARAWYRAAGLHNDHAIGEMLEVTPVDAHRDRRP